MSTRVRIVLAAAGLVTSLVVSSPAVTSSVGASANPTTATATATASASAPVANESTPRAGTPPTKPLGVTIAAQDRAVLVTWKKPVRSGSRPITGYRVQRSVSGGAWATVTTVAPSIRALRVGPLSNGTTVRVRVAAISRAGASRWSSVRSTVLPTATQIAAGENATCALLPSRQVMCWGANAKGQLGIGNSAIARIPVPVLVPGLTDIRQVGVGADHACALRGNGTVWCWGESIYGQLSVASVGNHAPSPVQIPGVTTATQLTTGKYHTCVRTAAGGVQCWGNNTPYGQTGGGPTTSLVTLPLTGVSEVRAGGLHTCARLSDGTVRCWGWNKFGQSGGVPSDDPTLTPTAVPGISTAQELALGENFSCARLSDGNAACWGNGGQGQLGDGSNASSTTTPQQVTDLGTIVSISSGHSAVCAAYSDASVRCWGSDFFGPFGDGTSGDGSTTPVASFLGPARVVGLGGSTGCAIRTTGRVACAGRNNEGQLGVGSTTLSASPVTPNGF